MWRGKIFSYLPFYFLVIFQYHDTLPTYPDAIPAMSVNIHKKTHFSSFKSLLKSGRDYELINSDCSIIDLL